MSGGERITPCRFSAARDRWEAITWPGKPTAYPCAHDHAHCERMGCVGHDSGAHTDSRGDIITHVGCALCCPTPVPSEADPGTGARECQCAPRHGVGFVVHQHPCRFAATPDAGDVEALASAVYRSGEVNLPLADSLDVDCHDVARAVLASDWLASHDAATADRVRREGAALVRDDIQARRREFRRLNADQQYLNALDDAYGLAANRAREAGR